MSSLASSVAQRTTREEHSDTLMNIECVQAVVEGHKHPSQSPIPGQTPGRPSTESLWRPEEKRRLAGISIVRTDSLMPADGVCAGVR